MSEKHCRKPENVLLLPAGNAIRVNTDVVNKKFAIYIPAR
jgi:hypothetical protein